MLWFIFWQPSCNLCCKHRETVVEWKLGGKFLRTSAAHDMPTGEKRMREKAGQNNKTEFSSCDKTVSANLLPYGEFGGLSALGQPPLPLAFPQ